MRRVLLPLLVLLAVASAAQAWDPDPSRDARRVLDGMRAPPPPEPPLLGLLRYPGSVAEPPSLADDESLGDEDEDEDEAFDAELLGEVIEAWLRDAARTSPDAWPGLAADLGRRIELEVEVTRVDGEPWRGSVSTRSGRRVTLATTEALTLLSGYDVEIACDNTGGECPSALGDPQVRVREDGVSLALRPFLVGDRIFVGLAAQTGRFQRPVATLETGARFLGNLDLPRYRGGIVQAFGPAAVEKPLETSLDVGGDRFEVRVRARASAAVAASSGLAFLDASLLIRPPRTLALLDELEDGTLGDLGPWRARGYATLPPRALRDLVRQTTPDADVELGPGGGLWMRGRTEDLRPALGAWLGRAARSVAVDLRLLADGRLLGRARLVARSGGAAFVRVGRDQAYLRDADVEVG